MTAPRGFWRGPWKPLNGTQPPPGTFTKAPDRGDLVRDFDGGRVTVDLRTGGWRWIIWVREEDRRSGWRIVKDGPAGWGTNTKRDCMDQAARAVRDYVAAARATSKD